MTPFVGITGYEPGTLPLYGGMRYSDCVLLLKKESLLTPFVGIPGFEPGTPCSQSRCATGLRYIPNIFFSGFKTLRSWDPPAARSRARRDALPDCATSRNK